jgi:hypothetical protein
MVRAHACALKVKQVLQLFAFAAVLCAVPCADELRASQGQGLVAAMRDVPAPFFQESFDVDQQQLWEEVVQVSERAFAAAVATAANDARAVGCRRRIRGGGLAPAQFTCRAIPVMPAMCCAVLCCAVWAVCTGGQRGRAAAELGAAVGLPGGG